MITLLAAIIAGVFSVLVACIAHARKNQGTDDPLVNRSQRIQEFYEEYMLKAHPLFIRNSRAQALVGSRGSNFHEVVYLLNKPLFESLAIELAKFRWFFTFKYKQNGFIDKIQLNKTKVFVLIFLCLFFYVLFIGFAMSGLDSKNGTISEIQAYIDASKYISVFNLITAKLSALIAGIVLLIFAMKLLVLFALAKEITK